MSIQINENYFNLVPRPEPNQINSLRDSMKEDGQQIAIIVNENGIILDGHTRFNICKELNLEPKTIVKKFTSVKLEKEFVVSANLNRRQLTLFERGEILFTWWKDEKKRGRETGGYAAWEKRRTGKTTGGTVTGKKERLLQRFARIIGSSASVCHQLTWLMLNADEDTKIQLRKEEISIAGAYNLLSDKKRKTVADYKKEGAEYLRFPVCLNCSGKTVDAKKSNCHVHNNGCCTKCRWGY